MSSVEKYVFNTEQEIKKKTIKKLFGYFVTDFSYFKDVCLFPVFFSQGF